MTDCLFVESKQVARDLTERYLLSSMTEEFIAFAGPHEIFYKVCSVNDPGCGGESRRCYSLLIFFSLNS